MGVSSLICYSIFRDSDNESLIPWYHKLTRMTEKIKLDYSLDRET
jgi:hypothetical protein